jgi:Protein of unknown function (DUF1566)
MTAPTRLLGGTILGALVVFAGVTRAAAPAGRYTITSGTVYDTKTKLTWQQAVSGTYAWGGGSIETPGTPAYYCSVLSLNGAGWRLPTVNELLSIVDYSTSSPAIDPSAFPGTPSNLFWSTTLQHGDNGQWAVDFSYGSVGWVYTTGSKGNSSLNVRCVR